MYKIGVVIPITKEIPEWELKEAIPLWEKQTRPPDEVIVVDWDKLLDKEEVFSEARCNNVAVKKTKCDYLIFTNVDIRPDRKCIQVVEETLEKKPNQILMCARLDLPEDSFKPGIDWDKEFDGWAKRGHSHPAPGSIQVISVDWLKKVGGYDERYIGWGYYDCEILNRASMDGIESEWIDSRTVILHLGHPKLPHRSYEKRNLDLYQEKVELNVNKDKEWGKE